MRRFTDTEECPKCEYDTIKVWYNCVSGSECMALTCCQCGYSWHVLPADADVIPASYCPKCNKMYSDELHRLNQYVVDHLSHELAEGESPSDTEIRLLTQYHTKKGIAWQTLYALASEEETREADRQQALRKNVDRLEEALRFYAYQSPDELVRGAMARLRIR